MIFSGLFKPKWQHHDINVRLQAIQSLDAQTQQDELLQVVETDSQDKAVMAALNKLNQSSYWFKALQRETQSPVHQLAYKKLLKAALNESDLRLTEQQYQDFINLKHNKDTIELLIKKSRDFETKKLLTLQLNRPHLITELLLATEKQPEQQQLLELIDDESSLNKLLKKTNNASLKALVEEKLAIIHQNKEKPVLVEKQTRLLLAKLNALKEQSDLDALEQQREEMSKSWENLSTDFGFLETHLAEEFSAKYQQISQQLEQRKQAGLEAWEASKEEQRIANQKLTAIDAAEKQLKAVSNAVNKLVEQQTQLPSAEELAALNQSLEQAESALSDVESDAQVENLQSRIQSGKQSITALPDFLEKLNLVEVLLVELSEQQEPQDKSELDDRQHWYNEWKERWEQQIDGLGLDLPVNIERKLADASKRWHKAFGELRGQVRRDFKYCQNKFKAVQNLIEQGKYRAAIGLFDKVKASFDAMPEKEKEYLARAYQNTAEKVAELKDWQEYIAVPKKQQLLDQVLELVNNPLASPADQAQQIKQMRANWNSLGNVDDDQDKAINAAFDEACEQAFTPCRAYYAEQEAVREENYQRKLKLIESLEDLNQQTEQQSVFTNQQLSLFNSLQAKWSSIGEVDRKVFRGLMKQYRHASEPVRKKAEYTWQENARQKTQIIQQAKALLDGESLEQAANEAKKLQKQWQEVGYAGQSQDNKLWQDFRAVNDELFGKVAEQNQDLRQQLSGNLDEAEKVISQLAALKTLSDIAEIRAAMASYEDEFASIDELPHKQRKDIEQRFKLARQEVHSRIKDIQQSEKQAAYKSLFNVLKSNSTDALETINKDWSSAVLDTSAIDELKLQQTTIKLELMSGVDSPDSDQAQRQQLQVEMLAEKLQQGETETSDSLFLAWLKYLNAEDCDSDIIHRAELCIFKN